MTVELNRNADFHLADVLSEQIAMTRPGELLAEAAEDFGDERALANEFDSVFARAIAQERRRSITSRFQEFVAAILAPTSWKLVATTAAAMVVFLVGGAYYLADRAKETTKEIADTQAKSEIYWRQVAEAQDRELDALQARIDAIERAGDLAAAESSAKQYLVLAKARYGEEHPRYVNALNNLAGIYSAKGDIQAAEPLYKRAVVIVEKALGPDDASLATALSNLALIYDSQGRYADAAELLGRSVAISEKALGPDHLSVATGLSNLAAAFGSLGRYAEAESLLKRSLTISEKALGRDAPEVAAGRKRLEELQAQLAQPHDATAAREEAIRLAEEFRQRQAAEQAERLAEDQRIAREREAAAQREKQERPDVAKGECGPAQDLDLAIKACSKLIAGNPDDADAYRQRGQAYSNKGDYAAAIADFSQAIRFARDDTLKPVAYGLRGDAYRLKRDFDRAIRDADEAIRLAPRNPLGYRVRGFAYTGKSDYDRAIDDFGAAIKLTPDALSLGGRGYAYFKRGDSDRAIADLTEAIRLDPNSPIAYVWRANVYVAMGERQKAAEDYDKSFSLSAKAKPGRDGQSDLSPQDFVQQVTAQLGPDGASVRVSLHGGNTVKLGSEFALEVTSDIGGRLVIIDVNADGAATPIFPNEYVANKAAGLIRPKETMAVPGDGYGFRAVPPVGKGLLIALVVPEDFRLSPVIAAPERAKGFTPERSTVGYFTSLRHQIAAQLSSQRMVETHQQPAWAIQAIEYEIAP